MANRDTAEAARTRIEMTHTGKKLLKCFVYYFRVTPEIAVTLFNISTTVYVNSLHPPTVFSVITKYIKTVFRFAGWRRSAIQEAHLSPRDRAMRRVNWNLANCHATEQKLVIRQVMTKSMVWSWRFSRRQCVIDNVHSTMTRPSRLPLSQVS